MYCFQVGSGGSCLATHEGERSQEKLDIPFPIGRGVSSKLLNVPSQQPEVGIRISSCDGRATC